MEDSQKVELDVSVQATAFGGKTKKVNVAPKLIGARAAANINHVIVTAFNQALEKAGKDKVHKVYGYFSFTATIGQEIHASSTVLRNNTKSKELNEWLGGWVDHIEMLIQSPTLEFKTSGGLSEGKTDINFQFEIPSGAGMHATQDRSKAAIFQKKSVITIKNDDDSCFWHAMTVLLNENHPSYKHIKEGRPMRTDLAKLLCRRCNMEWDTPVSIDQIEHLEEILKCNIRVFDADNIPILNTTQNIYNSLMYKSEFNAKYKQCYLLFDNNHYH